MIHSLDRDGRSLLAYAAASLNVEVFQYAIKIYYQDLPQQQQVRSEDRKAYREV